MILMRRPTPRSCTPISRRVRSRWRNMAAKKVCADLRRRNTGPVPRQRATVDPARGSRHLGDPLSDEPKKPSMRRTVSLGMFPLALAVVMLAACDNIADLRGFAPTPGTVDKLEVGTQSREDIQRLIGSPSSVATFNPNVWYYISEKQEYWGPSRPWISEQSVIQITFNETGRVQNIKYFDLNDAQNIT